MNKGGNADDANRIDELENVINLGKQIFGFFDGLMRFYYEITPLLGRINQSIEESSSKLPRASDSLSRVTKETERATIEILDILETMSQTIEEGKAQIQEYRIRKQKRNDTIRTCIRYLDTVAQTLPVEDAGKLRKKISEITPESEDEDILSSVPGYFDKIADYTSDISISLQVQDITSQQLAAVNHLVESVHGRLKHLLDNYSGAESSPISEMVGSDPSTFDAEAEYNRSGDKQNLADALSEQHRQSPASQNSNKEAGNTQILPTQAEIDKMFGS